MAGLLQTRAVTLPLANAYSERTGVEPGQKYKRCDVKIGKMFQNPEFCMSYKVRQKALINEVFKYKYAEK